MLENTTAIYLSFGNENFSITGIKVDVEQINKTDEKLEILGTNDEDIVFPISDLKWNEDDECYNYVTQDGVVVISTE